MLTKLSIILLLSLVNVSLSQWSFWNSWPAYFNPCSSNPCRNGGTCYYQIGAQSFTCSCPPYTEGSVCQITPSNAINPCMPNYCQNNAICSVVAYGSISQPGEYHCTCQYGFAGSLCQYAI